MEEIIVVRRDAHGVVSGLYGLETFDPAEVQDVAEWIQSTRREVESELESD